MHGMQGNPPTETHSAIPSRGTSRRFKGTIRRIDPWSVLKLSVAFYLAVMAVCVLATVLLFYAADAAGIIGTVEEFIQGVGWPDFRIRPVQVFRAVAVIGVFMMIIWTAVSVFVAFLYNLVADLVGGIEVTMSERDF
ncbi:MAG TPA: DUF3566 domain-containing protein [Actinomycetota bacterium]|nr:DUF3566 domain-containing protein [Actinomycetota bacterium]